MKKTKAGCSLIDKAWDLALSKQGEKVQIGFVVSKDVEKILQSDIRYNKKSGKFLIYPVFVCKGVKYSEAIDIHDSEMLGVGAFISEVCNKLEIKPRRVIDLCYLDLETTKKRRTPNNFVVMVVDNAGIPVPIYKFLKENGYGFRYDWVTK